MLKVLRALLVLLDHKDFRVYKVLRVSRVLLDLLVPRGYRVHRAL